jgi:hypothetical protein
VVRIPETEGLFLSYFSFCPNCIYCNFLYFFVFGTATFIVSFRLIRSSISRTSLQVWRKIKDSKTEEVFWINRIVSYFLLRDVNRFRTRRVGLEVYCKLEILGNGNGSISCAPLLPVNLGSFPRIARCHDLRALPEQKILVCSNPIP